MGAKVEQPAPIRIPINKATPNTNLHANGAKALIIFFFLSFCLTFLLGKPHLDWLPQAHGKAKCLKLAKCIAHICRVKLEEQICKLGFCVTHSNQIDVQKLITLHRRKYLTSWLKRAFRLLICFGLIKAKYACL